MTAAREALVLPSVFLTVVLLGSLRIGDVTRLAPPTVFTLVLGVLLLRVVVQSGALATERLLSSSRSGLANANGAVLLVAAWLAGAQTIAVLIPDSGLPRLGFAVFFFILLLNTAAAAPDRVRLLRSLAVTLGATFLLKFVVLYELSAPGPGRLRQMLHGLFDSVTLGVLVQPAMHPAAGYLALVTVGLFLLGVFLLPARESAAAAGYLEVRRPQSVRRGS